ncbi:MAG: sigma-54-dependent Fis family transcriptional regulator, partial [Bacteroidales bacterium]|nr:sigma-54-dependent Fis family transcriptional regulator [Bacteroidales bacterium]
MANPLYPSLPILLVDDDEEILTSINLALSMSGIRNVVRCQDSQDLEPLLSEKKFSVIALDLYMPHISGLDLLPIILERYPETPVIVVTGANDLEIAVKCIKSGAFDYLVKPVDKIRLVTSVRHAIEKWEVRDEYIVLKDHFLSDRIENPDAFSSIISQSSSIHSIFKYVEAIAKTSLPILITGETGVGKELLAEAIHIVSKRPGGFVPVNVAGLDDTLFSDTLFGHKKGAFTSAVSDRDGMIRKASAGTLFLGEIGDLTS